MITGSSTTAGKVAPVPVWCTSIICVSRTLRTVPAGTVICAGALVGAPSASVATAIANAATSAARVLWVFMATTSSAVAASPDDRQSRGLNGLRSIQGVFYADEPQVRHQRQLQ